MDCNWILVSNNFVIQYSAHLGGHSAYNYITGTINFPISFTTAYSVVGSANDESDIVSFKDLFNSSVKFKVYDRYAEYLAYDNLWYIAIGF